MTEEITTSAIKSLKEAKNQAELEKLRLQYLGRKGSVTALLKAVGELPAAKRAAAGEAANNVRNKIEQALAEAEGRLRAEQLAGEGTIDEPLDLTIPTKVIYGHAHPMTAMIDDLVKVFWQMGYTVVDGPEVETEWYNFEALNMPPSHPARDMQDTFYLEGGNLSRTHTSGVQIRYMETHKPPIRIVSLGKVYRNEDEDARHSWMFHQIEGLVVDKGISMTDLKGTLLAMVQGVLGMDTQLRLRPSYFPYTEPSVEMDATCVICHGTPPPGGCTLCSSTGWVELGGAGMVHPVVLERMGVDPNSYSGFAFGFGPDRITAIKYHVPDVREFWRPNLKFLRQF